MNGGGFAMPDLQVDMAWPLALTVSIPVGLPLALFGIGKKIGRSGEGLLLGEGGASYALSFVMVLPLFLVVSLVWIEAGYLLMVKLACNQAAHAAARAAAVWLPMRQPGHDEAQIRLAARLALTPYGRTIPINLPPEPEDWSEEEAATQAEVAGQAFAQISGDEDAAGVIAVKFLDAARRTEVVVSFDSAFDATLNPDGEVEVAVSFRPAALIPWVSAIVQPSSLGKGYHLVQGRCVLPGEFPRNPLRSLSIPYSGPQ